jgi:hypothetical protein
MDREMNLTIALMLLMAMTASDACGEPLDQRFGPDRERGYRFDREFDQPDRDFKNRDRANFLAIKQPTDPDADLLMPQPDLQHPPTIGQQK